jgi:hypothetical protein
LTMSDVDWGLTDLLSEQALVEGWTPASGASL